MSPPRSVAEIKELYPSWLVKAAEKIYDRFLPLPGLREHAESEADRIMEGVINREGGLPPGLDPDVSPNSPQDIVRYHQQKAIERQIRDMIAEDERRKEERELHPAKIIIPRREAGGQGRPTAPETTFRFGDTGI